MRRILTVLCALLGIFASSRATAQEIQLTGPLAGAPAVRQLRLHRQGRVEIAPSVSFTLLDEYQRTILPGGRLTYNLADWLAIGVWGAFGAVKVPDRPHRSASKQSPRRVAGSARRRRRAQ